jgi:hypothetical protein
MYNSHKPLKQSRHHDGSEIDPQIPLISKARFDSTLLMSAGETVSTELNTWWISCVHVAVFMH